MYCPNCDEALSEASTDCRTCGAVFGAGSAWSPIKKPKRKKPAAHAPIFSRAPKIIHAAQAIFIFIAVGPPVGGLLSLLLAASQGPISLGLAAFMLTLGSYIVGGGAAGIAGCMYCVAAAAIALTMPRRKLSGVACGVIGCMSGGGAVWVLSGRTELMFVGIAAGAVAGCVSGTLLPVGVRRTAH